MFDVLFQLSLILCRVYTMRTTAERDKSTLSVDTATFSTGHTRLCHCCGSFVSTGSFTCSLACLRHHTVLDLDSL